MVVNLTHSQIILLYKENGGRIEPYTIVIMGDRLQTGEPYKGLAGAAVSPVLIASRGRDQSLTPPGVTRYAGVTW
jgi:hypothetical protein